MSNLSLNSLQEGKHNLQEMKTKSQTWSSKGYDVSNVSQMCSYLIFDTKIKRLATMNRLLKVISGTWLIGIMC